MRLKSICLLFSLFIGTGTEANTMWYSEKCRTNLETYWDERQKRCERCEVKYKKRAGYQFSPNCGRQDDGGQPAPVYEECEKGTFNNGSFVMCRKCTTCPPGQPALSLCSATMDTQCCEKKTVIPGICWSPETKTLTSTVVIPAESTSQPVIGLTTNDQSASNYHYAWFAVVPLLFLASLLTLIFMYKKGKCLCKSEASKVKENGNILLPHKHKNVEELLAETLEQNRKAVAGVVLKSHPLHGAQHIREAPLQTVLDNLDVLEELIMLLDPDSSVAKTTRHVATHCSFSSMWINYAYSMKESKSPLRAVLEAVTTRFPEWTVGHLAGVFHNIGRNDAVLVLAKLSVLKEKPCQNSCNHNDNLFA